LSTTNGSFYQNGLPISSVETGLGNVPSGLPAPNPASSSFYLSGTAYAQANPTLAAASASAAAASAAAAAASLATLNTTALLKANNLSDLASVPTALTNLGLQNVNNTSDVNKPVSTSQATADALVASNAASATSALSGTTTTALALKAPLASPALTGVPVAPTASVSTNTTQLATTAFVLGQAATAAPLMNSTALVGTSLLYARQDHVHATDTTLATLASPALTGTPTAPTATLGTNTTQLATTAFVIANGGGASWVNRRVAKTAAYTVGTSDGGATIGLGGTAFYALTFGTASGYSSSFTDMVANEDTGRAKWIIVTGGTSFYLWPGQSVLVFNDNNVWQVHGRSRFKLPSGVFTVNTDYGIGSDTFGVSDGLATGAGAFQSYQHALNFTLDQFDWNGTESGQTQLKILGAVGNVDGTQIHFSPHGHVAAQGGAAITIDGNGGSLLVTNQSAIQLYFDAVLQIRNINIQCGGTTSNCIDLLWGSKLYLQDLVTFTQNTTGGACLNVQDGAHVEFDNNFTWAQSGGYFILNNGATVRVASPITCTITNNISVINTVLGASPGVTDLANITWALGGHTVTATNKYNISSNHVLTGAANVPGSGVGITSSGGQDGINNTVGAKAWVNFSGVGSTTVNGSFNISSVTRASAGLYSVSFATPFASANYACTSAVLFNTGGHAQFCRIASMTSTGIAVQALDNTFSPADTDGLMLSFFGS
jgi:hypothetical protein